MDNKINRAISLLKLCQVLQSEKDGVDRPAFGEIDKSKIIDDFAKDVNESILYVAMLHKLLPMQDKLVEIGKKLEAQGKISVMSGESYVEVSLNYLITKLT